MRKLLAVTLILVLTLPMAFSLMTVGARRGRGWKSWKNNNSGDDDHDDGCNDNGGNGDDCGDDNDNGCKDKDDDGCKDDDGGCCTSGPGENSVEWIKEDTETKGDWRGKYGCYAYILPGVQRPLYEEVLGHFNTPIGPYDPDEPFDPNDLADPPWSWTSAQIGGLNDYKAEPPYWDEYWSRDPKVTYYLNGTFMVEGSVEIQYPTFSWSWEGWQSEQGADKRRVYYPIGDGTNHWRLAVWDDGGERSKPVHGYINVTLTFPNGIYLLSLYSYDQEKYQRESQIYRIYDENGENLLASKRISGIIFDEGVYETFKIVASEDDFTIIVQVYNDMGHDPGTQMPTINVLLAGIFVDKITGFKKICGLTIGFWKTNAAKDLGLMCGHSQVELKTYMELLQCVSQKYGVKIDDWEEWNIEGDLSEDDVKWALHWLSYGRYKPESNSWGASEANDPQVKARAQLLALLLTICYKGSEYESAYIRLPGYEELGYKSISWWVNYLIELYNNGEYKAVYCIATYINEHCAYVPLLCEPAPPCNCKCDGRHNHGCKDNGDDNCNDDDNGNGCKDDDDDCNDDNDDDNRNKRRRRRRRRKH